MLALPIIALTACTEAPTDAGAAGAPAIAFASPGQIEDFVAARHSNRLGDSLPRFALAAGASGEPQDSTLIDFEGLPQGTEVGDIYSLRGVRFTNLVVFVVGNFNSSAFPPRSGVALATPPPLGTDGRVGVLFSAPVSFVRMYVTTATSLVDAVTLACYLRETDLVPIVQESFSGPNYQGSGAAPNQPLVVQFAGITRCEVTGKPNQYAFDDFTFGTDAARVKIEIQEGRSLIAPTGLESSGGAPLLNGSPWPENAGITVSVVREDSTLRNQDVELALASVDSAGRSIDAPFGHFHGGAGGAVKPVGRLSSMQVNTGTTGTVTIVYTAGEVSGPVVITGTSAGVKAGADTILVGVPGLSPMGARSTYLLIGDAGVPEHPVNHYARPEFIGMLTALADSFHFKYGAPVLQYNDASLPLGGVFDLAQTWAPDHVWHRAGYDLDLRTHLNGNPVLSRKQLDFIENYWTNPRVCGQLVKHLVKAPHYHLYFRPGGLSCAAGSP
jgi:hypothetical protein